METFYLIDGTNNNKVVGEFFSNEEALEYVNNKEFTENWENGYSSFEEFKSEFRVIDSEEMEAAIKKYGSRMKKYFN